MKRNDMGDTHQPDDVFITEIELTRSLLESVFQKFYSLISPRKQEVNDMNYFPIMDHDTGDNLLLTLKSIIKGIRNTDHCSKKELIEDLQEDILLEAGRGNAGMVFTGWFGGFLDSLEDEPVLNTESLAQAMERGRKYSYGVFDRPRQGTILDPISRAAQIASQTWQKERNLFSLFERVISGAAEAVRKTTDSLDALLADKITPEEIRSLEQNQVVDAGALGFLIFLKGFRKAIAEVMQQRAGVVVMMEGDGFDEDSLKQHFSSLGESLDVRVSPSGKKFMLHIHTDFPKKVAEDARGFSKITHFRIEDISEEG